MTLRNLGSESPDWLISLHRVLHAILSGRLLLNIREASVGSNVVVNRPDTVDLPRSYSFPVGRVVWLSDARSEI